ncbi:MAG: hypothetical protein Ct9H300mP12_07170 [Acidimicrobiales bacterium]|nr:MAG: hypothetical protein Ct9H300mP12_07170 [Acidimicrobiales bacterium]
MNEFSLALTDEQEQLRDWIHQFCVDVVRPVAEEWDEREEFPGPRRGGGGPDRLYGWDFLAQGMLGDKTGLTLPVAIEELFWGDAGIGMAIMGTGLLQRASPLLAPRNRSWSGCPSATAPQTTSGWGRSVPVRPTPVRTSVATGHGPCTTRPATSGC